MTQDITAFALRHPEIMDYRLCYVEDGDAFFTSNFEDQWGDDWNDAPYEHNAGLPYYGDNCRTYMLKYSGGFLEPSHGQSNSPYSVEHINKGAIAWLRKNEYVTIDGNWTSEVYDVAKAGITITEFIKSIRAEGADVYSVIE